MLSGRAEDHPSLLNAFFLLVYPDIKHWRFLLLSLSALYFLFPSLTSHSLSCGTRCYPDKQSATRLASTHSSSLSIRTSNTGASTTPLPSHSLSPLLVPASQPSQLWQDMLSGKAERHPSLLNAFLLLVYPDIKHWRFHYAFAFPALALPSPATLASPPLPATQALSPQLAEAIEKACEQWRQEGSGRGAMEEETGAFTGEAESPEGGRENIEEGSAKEGESESTQGENFRPTPVEKRGSPFFLLCIDSTTFGTSSTQPTVTANPLTEYRRLATQKESIASPSSTSPPSLLLIAFFDPCHLPLSPGWPLRNLLLLASLRWQATSLHVLCLRQRHGRISLHHSLLLNVQIPPPPGT
ncbi:unnamed protein product [Closterium sp. NIES-53]